MNLLDETIRVLKDNGHTPNKVNWVGTNHEFMTWDNFKKVANKNYDDMFGGTEVKIDLMIIGDNWWLERHEYDGSEWWEYKELPFVGNRIFNPNMDIWEE